MKNFAIIIGALMITVAVLLLKTWLLMLVLGWFGIHVLTFWKALVVVLLISIFFSRK